MATIGLFYRFYLKREKYKKKIYEKVNNCYQKREFFIRKWNLGLNINKSKQYF